MSAGDIGHWRVELQTRSRLGTAAWLPVGVTFPTRSQAEAEALRQQKARNLPARVIEVAS